jgi:hypothetical protein
MQGDTQLGPTRYGDGQAGRFLGTLILSSVSIFQSCLCHCHFPRFSINLLNFAESVGNDPTNTLRVGLQECKPDLLSVIDQYL